MANSLNSEDIQLQREIFRSNLQCSTRLYVVKLLKDWTQEEFRRETTADQTDADVSKKFKKGETVVVKLFLDGPEEERKADAKRRRDNEYARLKRLNKNLSELNTQRRTNNEVDSNNWFVMALGIGQDWKSGPFVILEQGECSLGHLLHQRRDCRVLTGEQSGSNIGSIESSYYTKDHCFSFIVKICGALNFLHENKMMHRDLKSYNVLLFNDKTLCKLCDFEDCRDVSPRMTAKMGTTWWRAPELYKDIDSDGNAEYGIAADWYSFGLVMCELLFREEPFVCYYTGSMSDRSLDPSKVFLDKYLSSLPKWTELDRHAMYIDHTTHPRSPTVVINTDMCIFPDLGKRDNAPKLWSLVDELLTWDPIKRTSVPDRNSRFELGIQPYATGSPPPIRLLDRDEPTDTGARYSETAMSWKPAVGVSKVYLLANECDLANDALVKEIEKRLQDRTEDIRGMISDDPEVANLVFLLCFKRSINRFVLSVEGDEMCAKRTALFLSTDPQFVSYMTDQFRFHPNPSAKGITIQIKPKD